MEISDLLARFNRKERYWVVQTVLGSGAGHPSMAFCEQLNRIFGTQITPSARWWMDYHLDWLYAALAILVSGEDLTDVGRDLQVADVDALTGQQEDIDLVVAEGNDLFLIEAKGFSAWSTGQMASKLRRIGQIARLAGDHANLHLHLGLLSHGQPARLEQALGAQALQFQRLPLHIEPGEYFAVGRRAPRGAGATAGGWRAFHSKTIAKPE